MLSTTHTDSGAFYHQFGSYTISGLAAGYYLIQDKANSVTGERFLHFLHFEGDSANVTVTPKSTTPTVDKKVQDEPPIRNKEFQ